MKLSDSYKKNVCTHAQRLHGSDHWTCLTLTDPPQTPSLVVILIDEMTYRRK